ncbi:MAG TPA: hypothetical protein PKO06_07540, partial [Candidatus Ozemobacteraceae bacterium]|nr:hypothetical protein [Candidatus Ozemobacteraceae bacterium]
MKRIAILMCLVIMVVMATSPLRAAPANAEAAELVKQAEEAFKAQDLEKASTLMQQALTKEPDNAVFRYIFARILFAKKDYMSAKENFEIVSRSRPSKEKGDDY